MVIKYSIHLIHTIPPLITNPSVGFNMFALYFRQNAVFDARGVNGSGVMNLNLLYYAVCCVEFYFCSLESSEYSL